MLTSGNSTSCCAGLLIGSPAKGCGRPIAYLQRLADNGVGFHSYTEPLLSTDNEMVRDIVLAVMAALAKQERIRIGERTRAGLARVRASGKHLGRPKLDAKREQAVREALAAGMGINRVARMVGTGNATVAAIAAKMRQGP
jgi:DNA invertase Pin-like site-specific DNA recombinase